MNNNRSIIRKIIEKEEMIGVALFVLVFSSKYLTLDIAYVDDELGYVMPAAKWVQENGFNPFSGVLSAGHPPLFFEIIAMIWTIFENNLWVTHLVVSFFSFLTLYFTFLLGTHLQGKISGLIAALFLFFSPNYFAHSGIGTLDMPLTTFAVMTLYFFYKNNYKAYLISGICLVLTKETGVIFISAITTYVIYKNYFGTKRDVFKQALLFSIPIWAYLIWLIANRFVVGWFFYPFNASLFSVIKHYNVSLLTRVPNQLFLNDFRWILTIIILTSMLIKKTLIKKEFLPILFILSFLTVFFAVISLPRHFLIIYPVFFIISSIAFCSLFGKNKIILSLLTLLAILMFSMKWHGKSIQHEWAGPNNLEYIDYIKVQKSAIRYIETNHPDATVAGEFFGGSRMFREPYLGYVNNPLDTIDLTFYKKPLEHKQFLILYYFPSIFAGKISMKVIQNLNLKLLEKFEKNGKFVELYARERT